MRHSSFFIDLRSSLLTLGIAQTSLALLSLNRSLLHSSFFILSSLLLCLAVPGHAQERRSDAVDNVLEYVPYASLIALKACGVESRDRWMPLVATTAATWVATAGSVYVLKHSIHETRPDGSNNRSFPSGHTAISFAGATLLHHEYHDVSPWISVAGYSVATFVGIDRVLRDRHHWYDVAAGAGIGFAAAEVTWWLSRKIFKTRSDQVMIGLGGNTLDVAVRF